MGEEVPIVGESWPLPTGAATLTSSFLTLAQVLRLPEKDAQQSAQIIAAVQEWLRISTNYLLILDNADNLALARDFLPPSCGGHVLLTTRAQATGRFARRLEVETLSIDQGALLLLRRAGVLVQNAPLEQACEMDRHVAREICEEVGGLPLALDQAGGYIEETQSSLEDYQILYRTQRAALLEERGGLVLDHPEAVATTWKLSFERVEQQNPAAADLLRLCAFLAPDAIPETIITQGGEQLGPQLHELAAHPLALNRAIGVLGAYSLLRRDAGSHTLSVHRLVQAVLKDQMDQESQRQWVERTVRALNVVFPQGEHQTWPVCEQVLPHALICARWLEEDQFVFAEAGSLLTQAGWVLSTWLLA